jgi:diaminopimelate epimerase
MGVVKLLGPAERCNVGHGQMMVELGNPHLVVLGSDPDMVDVEALGRAIEATEPGGLNVEFVALGPGRDELTMRVWERGVGETLACGSGSVAAAAAMHHWGKVGTKVTVHQRGGPVEVDLKRLPEATLSGPSQLVATCTVDRAALP